MEIYRVFPNDSNTVRTSGAPTFSTPQVPTRVIFRGVLPFMTVDCVRLAILVALPILSTWLPSHMK